MKINKSARLAAIDRLKKHIKPSDKIVIIITTVSCSGMSRRMRVFTHQLDVELTSYVGRAIGSSVNHRGVLVRGCGFNQALALVDDITNALWSSGENPEYKSNGEACIDWQVICI